jgi:hypothetical protein
VCRRPDRSEGGGGVVICQWNQQNRRCEACNWKLPPSLPLTTIRPCDGGAAETVRTPQLSSNPLPLGNYAETLLSSIGVTPDRYKEAKRLFGLPPTCHCEQRKEWLNRVGKWVAGLTQPCRPSE